MRLGATEVPDGADAVIQCTGSVAGRREYEVGADAAVVDVAELRRGDADLPAEGDVVVFDPVGGPIGVALAEELGARAVLVTQDHIAGNELSRTGDLARRTPGWPGPGSASNGARCCGRCAPARSRSRTGSRGPAARSPARPSSTAASASPTSRCPARRRRPAIVSPRGRSTRPSSRVAGWRGRSRNRRHGVAILGRVRSAKPACRVVRTV